MIKAEKFVLDFACGELARPCQNMLVQSPAVGQKARQGQLAYIVQKAGGKQAFSFPISHSLPNFPGRQSNSNGMALKFVNIDAVFGQGLGHVLKKHAR